MHLIRYGCGYTNPGPSLFHLCYQFVCWSVRSSNDNVLMCVLLNQWYDMHQISPSWKTHVIELSCEKRNTVDLLSKDSYRLGRAWSPVRLGFGSLGQQPFSAEYILFVRYRQIGFIRTGCNSRQWSATCHSMTQPEPCMCGVYAHHLAFGKLPMHILYRTALEMAAHNEAKQGLQQWLPARAEER